MIRKKCRPFINNLNWYSISYCYLARIICSGKVSKITLFQISLYCYIINHFQLISTTSLLFTRLYVRVSIYDSFISKRELAILSASNDEFQALYTLYTVLESVNHIINNLCHTMELRVNKTPQTQAHFVCI